MASDRFRDWGLYHKAVAALVAGVVLSVVVRALIAIDAAYEIKDQIVIEASAAEIWPWVIENDKRSDWQGEVIRLNGVSTDVGRSRMLYWKRDYKRWRSYEVTTEIVPQRRLKTEQESDIDRRWWQVELVPQSPCRTRVILTEHIKPTLYADRFWFFQVREQRQKRLENSVRDLKRWVEKTSKACRMEAKQTPPHDQEQMADKPELTKRK